MEEQFYIQKGFVGNSMMWWRKSDCGYSVNLKEARVFSKEEALEIRSRPYSNKKAWPKEYIDKKTTPQADVQDCDFKQALSPNQNS